MEVRSMRNRLLAGLIAAGMPIVGATQVVPGELSMEERQEALEQRVREQDARIEQLERLLQETREAESASGAAPAAPAAAPAPTPVPAAGSSTPPAEPVSRPPAANPGPEYIGNLGVKLYESDRAQIYMRL